MGQHKHMSMDVKRFIIFAALVVMLLFNPCSSLQEVGSHKPIVQKQELMLHNQWRKLLRVGGPGDGPGTPIPNAPVYIGH
ncbi:hypothetical protein QJS04_geneDACA007874 [Acorus gramineus]|uniref:Transmembrane protein n=1 Tax=Acorus gramineus TaxID=55184 RepID=A0AAV9B9Y0_ACOGR|nr:hypothetical protein QJS04_geneDACA007874 [Acorus gramineus]